MSKNKFKPTTKQQKKIKVLAYMDAPVCATGFGTVSRNILTALYNTGRYELEVLSINYWGNPHSFPAKLWPVGTNNDHDPYGRKKVFGMIPQMMGDQTILFFLQDTFILDFLPQLHEKLNADGKKYKSVAYWPVDGKPKEQWLKNVNSVDYPVTYSEWGRKQVFEVYPEFNKDLMVIPHGANLKDFYVLNQKDITSFKSQFFGENRDKFIFSVVSRNQQRKDIPRTIMAFKEFQKQVPNSILYLHLASKDQGWNLPEVCKTMGLSTEKDVILPQNFSPNQGYPIEVVNMIYNCSDCVISTTLGEGVGLCLDFGTNVYTENGTKHMNKLIVNDKVLSSDGTYNKVEAIMIKDHDGDLYEVTTLFSDTPIKSSPEHGFLVNISDAKYEWKKASELTIGDVLVSPKKDFDGAKQDNLYSLLPIKDITVSKYKGKLIDIQVANTNDFVAENCVVHNSWLEAMATKTPVIFPGNTALTENITEDRGYLVKSGTNQNLFTCLPNDNEIIRPLTDLDDMVKTMLHVYNNYDEAMEKAENAYNWISMKMDWQGDIAKKWVEVFDKAAEDLDKNNPTISDSEKDKVIEAEAV